MKKLLIIITGVFLIFSLNSCSRAVFIRSYNFQNQYIKVEDNFIVTKISKIETEADIKNAKFKIVPGLFDRNDVSIESAEYKNYFLRHNNGHIQLNKMENNDIFRKDATFKMIPGLADPTWTTFESVNFPGYYIRHSFGILFISAGNDDFFKKDATFKTVKTLEEK
jgi:arabinan endo-1,5-alpha-L-arabinosidase